MNKIKMASKLMIFLVMAFAVLIVGCSNIIRDGHILETPAKHVPSLNIYGKLIDFSQDGNLVMFKLQSEFVNFELNASYLEVKSEIKPSSYLVENALLLENLTKGNSYVFYSSKLSENEPHWNRADITENLEAYVERGKWNHENDLVLERVLNDAEFISVEEPTQSGERDSKLRPATQQVLGTRIFPTSLIPGEETEIKVKLTNKQDVSIPYRISDVKVVDERIWEPNLRTCENGEHELREMAVPQQAGKASQDKIPVRVCSPKSTEQSLEEATLSNCKVSYDSSENLIQPSSSKILDFKILCKEPISCKNWFESETYGKVTAECDLVLIGDFQFMDELKNIHVKNSHYLKQDLTLSEKAFASVQYSKEIKSKDDFYISIDYKDAEGNEIKDAQVELQFRKLGASGILTLRYDESLGRYKFKWSDFQEWDPGYKKGTYSFTISSIKTGYATAHSGPFEFELK